jgi:orotidine-5'-phosphate decarboxylase
VAIKPQLACFERLGWRGMRVLEEVSRHAQSAGLLVIADGKRGDVPVSAKAYAEALSDGIDSPWGRIPGLGADAFTVNPFTGRDSIEPFVAAAESSGSGLFALVRTSNPGAADIQDLESGGAPIFEHVAAIVDGFTDRLESADGRLSGMGAVTGATEPEHLARLRELMPRSLFLIPGVGAQGGRPEDLGPAFLPGRAGAIVTASRSIANDPDPPAAAERLREAVWQVSESPDQLA